MSNCHLKNKIITEEIACKQGQSRVGWIHMCTSAHLHRTCSFLTQQEVKHYFCQQRDIREREREEEMKRERGSKGGDGKTGLGKKFSRWVGASGSKRSYWHAGESFQRQFRSLILTGVRKIWEERRKWENIFVNAVIIPLSTRVHWCRALLPKACRCEVQANFQNHLQTQLDARQHRAPRITRNAGTPFNSKPLFRTYLGS